MKLYKFGPGLEIDTSSTCVQKYKLPEVFAPLVVMNAFAQMADGYGFPIRLKSSAVFAGFPLSTALGEITPLFTLPEKVTDVVAEGLKLKPVGPIIAYPFPLVMVIKTVRYARIGYRSVVVNCIRI